MPKEHTSREVTLQSTEIGIELDINTTTSAHETFSSVDAAWNSKYRKFGAGFLLFSAGIALTMDSVENLVSGNLPSIEKAGAGLLFLRSGLRIMGATIEEMRPLPLNDESQFKLGI